VSEESRKAPALNVGDSIGVVALVFAIFAFVVTPPVWLKLLLLIAAAIAIWFAVHLSHWTHSLKMSTRIILSGVASVALLLIGVSQIEDQLRAEHRMTLGTGVSNALQSVTGFLSRPWPQRLAFIALGMLLLFSGWIVFTRVAAYLKQRRTNQTSDKGFLDYKLQTETAIEELGPAIKPISQIMGEIMGLLQHAVDKNNPPPSSLPTHKQIRVLKRLATKIDSLSQKMDEKCVGLERVGNLLTEGMVNWFNVKYAPSGAKQLFESTTASLRKLCESIGQTQKHTDEYLVTIENTRGLSQDMNLALTSHAKSVRRVREANQKILDSCVKALKAAEDAESGEWNQPSKS